jgi:DNA-binding MarR family transcriptional regulator
MADRQIDARVADVRRFNRFYTRQIGLLREAYLDSPFSLSETRVLYELAHRERPTATELGRDLGLDAGYLSRILRGFQKRGLLKRTQSEHDGRQSHLALTPRGQAAFAPLNTRSRDEIGAMLGTLPASEQTRLVQAMHTIEGILGAEPSGRCRTCSDRTSRATWAGSCTVTPRSTPRNTAGTSASRRWSRAS